jgi:predicted thioesterase
VHVDLSHDTPTPPSCTVTVTAELTAAAGRQPSFAVEASDVAAAISHATHGRAVIATRSLEHRLRGRAVGADT